MANLKLGAIVDDKPVKVTVELPASVHRDLVAYAEIYGRETGQSVADPARLIAPMIERFMATDRGFAKLRRASGQDGRMGLPGPSIPSDRPAGAAPRHASREAE